ncbi:uncharacterized protein LJ206_005218 [Theristicus caerulescens]
MSQWLEVVTGRERTGVKRPVQGGERGRSPSPGRRRRLPAAPGSPHLRPLPQEELAAPLSPLPLSFPRRCRSEEAFPGSCGFFLTPNLRSVRQKGTSGAAKSCGGTPGRQHTALLPGRNRVFRVAHRAASQVPGARSGGATTSRLRRADGCLAGRARSGGGGTTEGAGGGAGAGVAPPGRRCQAAPLPRPLRPGLRARPPRVSSRGPPALPRGARRRGSGPGSPGGGRGERDFVGVCGQRRKAKAGFALGAGSGVGRPVPRRRVRGSPGRERRAPASPGWAGVGARSPVRPQLPSALPQGHGGSVPAAPRRGAGACRRCLGQRQLPAPASPAPHRDLRPAGGGGPLPSPGRCPAAPLLSLQEKIKRKRVGFAPRALVRALPAAPSCRRSHPSSPEHPLGFASVVQL